MPQMNIRRMLPMGTHQRKCIVCGYPIHAISEALTVHELICLGIEIERPNDKKRR
jgi:hypothetical protein